MDESNSSIPSLSDTGDLVAKIDRAIDGENFQVAFGALTLCLSKVCQNEARHGLGRAYVSIGPGFVFDQIAARVDNTNEE